MPAQTQVSGQSQFPGQSQYVGHATYPVQQQQPPGWPTAQSASGTKMNGLAVAAFTGVAFVVVVSALSFAFSNFLLGDMMFAQFGEVGYQIVFWGKLVLPVVLYTVGLVMGIVATRPGRSNRGKMLGYVAIGGAACGLVTKVLLLAGSSLITLFY